MATKTAEVKDGQLFAVTAPAESASLSAYGPARSTVQGTPLSAEDVAQNSRLLASLQLSRASA